MVGTFPLKEKSRRMSGFAGEIGTVLKSLRVKLLRRGGRSGGNGQLRLGVFLVIAVGGFFAPLANAVPGIVVGSFNEPSNAEPVAERARRELSNLGNDIEVRIVPRGSDRQSGVRVVVFSTNPSDTRRLLQQVRSLGFADAWYLAESGVTYRASQAVRSAEPAQRPAAAMLPTQQTASPTTVRTPAPAVAPQPGAGPQTVVGQEAGVDLHRLTIQTLADADVDIVIDGNIDEALWQQLPFYDNMLVSIPALVTPAEYATKMRIFATEKGLYVSSDMEQPPQSLVKRYSRRDDFFDRDTFGVTIDASGEALVAYWFFVALGDSLSDGKVLPERRFQRDWDGPWLGKSAETANGWSAEFFLPWSMMNMPAVDGPRTIGFAAKRNISATNQSYGWPGYPQSSSRFVSALNELEVEGVQPRAQVSVIPFTALTHDQVYDETEARVGVDFSWKPSPKVEIAATANPDFGAVEADDVVLNLTASETFFPEKRLFFLEGNEVFSIMPRDDFSSIYRIATNEDYATTSRQVYLNEFVPVPVSLLNTRRIGGTANQIDTAQGVTVDRGQRDTPTDLIGAAKVTGGVGDVRYGVLAAVEDDINWRGRDANGTEVDVEGAGRDFAVARLVYEDVGASRKALGYMGTFVGGSQYDATVHSIDAHYGSASGKLKADLQLINSDRDDVLGYGGMIDVIYASASNLRHKFEVDYMDEDVNFNDLGFLRRNNYGRLRYVMLYNQPRLNSFISNYRTTLSLVQQYNIDRGQVNDSAILWRSSMVLPGRNTLRTGLGYLPRRYEDLDSRGNGAYRVDAGGWWEVVLSTDANQMFSYSASVSAISEHLGDWSQSFGVGVTIRPLDAISMDLDLAYRNRNGWMVYQGGRNFGRFDGNEWQPSFDINWFIAPGHQLRWNLQWAGVRATDEGFFEVPNGDGDLIAATRIEDSYDFNLGLLTTQLRYRWEIAPLTDFFLVYNRGNSLRNALQADADEITLDDLWSDSFNEPVIDTFVAKLRYRFGN